MGSIGFGPLTLSPLTSRISRISRFDGRRSVWWADGRRAEATCKSWRALRVPVDKARLEYLGAYLAAPQDRWEPAGRGHPGFVKREQSNGRRKKRAPVLTWGVSASLERIQDDIKKEWMARLAARGLPPDWTEEDLRRQGHDLDATQEEESSSEEEEESSSEEYEEIRTGVPSALLADIETPMSHEALLLLPFG